MRKIIILAFATAGLAVCAVVTDLVRAYAGEASTSRYAQTVATTLAR
jgi:hypothetical protein